MPQSIGEAVSCSHWGVWGRTADKATAAAARLLTGDLAGATNHQLSATKPASPATAEYQRLAAAGAFGNLP